MTPPSGITVPPFGEIWSEVAESARDITDSTAWMRRGSPLGCLLMVVMTIGLASGVIGVMALEEPRIGIPLLAIGVVAVGVPLLIGLRAVKRAGGRHTSDVLTPIIGHVVDRMSATPAVGDTATLRAQYDPTGRIPTAVLRHSGFLREPRAPQRNLIHGRFGATDFAMVEVKWEAAEVPDSSGLVDASASLLYFTADFHKTFSSHTQLLPRKFDARALRGITDEDAQRKGLEPLRLEDPRITRLFDCWTDDQVEARYLITPELMVAITDLVDRLDSQTIALSFTGERLNLAVVSTTTILGLDIENPDAEVAARRVYDNLVLFLSLVEHFDLNTRIWSKH